MKKRLKKKKRIFPYDYPYNAPGQEKFVTFHNRGTKFIVLEDEKAWKTIGEAGRGFFKIPKSSTASPNIPPPEWLQPKESQTGAGSQGAGSSAEHKTTQPPR